MREPHKTRKPDKTSKDVRIPMIHVVPPQDYISSDGFWGEERLRPADLPGSWSFPESTLRLGGGWERDRMVKQLP